MKANKRQSEFTKWMGHLLDALRELGGSGKPREVSEYIAKKLNLPTNILEETLKSGASRFHNQVAWARQYLVWEGFLESSKRGVWILTQAGRNKKISEEEGRRIFLKWVDIHKENRENKSKNSSESISSDEIDYDDIDVDEASQLTSPSLVEVLLKLTPKGFEEICGALLRESGFLGVTVTGKSSDGGIDGFGMLEINPFISSKVIFQCKRYSKTKVSREEIGDFRNAVLGRAERGILITTGQFTSSAIAEANRDGVIRIDLVDGEKLVEMFQRVELGVKPRVIYDIDMQYFKQFMETK